MLRLRLLGAVELRGMSGDTVPGFTRSPKLQALLAYLATAPQQGARRRDSVSALLWPERDQTHARHALRQLLTRLRRLLGEAALACDGEEGLRLTTALHSDVRQFEDSLKAGRLEEAVDLYAGPFLEGFHLSDAPDFEAWSDEQRQRLHCQVMETADHLILRAREQLDSERERHWLTRALELDPFSESRSRRLVSLHLERGDRGAAVMEQERLSRRIEDDLGLPLQLTPVALHQDGRSVAGRSGAAAASPALAADEELRRGQYHFQRWSTSAMERSLTHFSRALSIEPDAAAPHAGLAISYAMLGHFGHLPPGLSFPRVEASARRALELESGLADAQLALGIKAHLFDRDVEQALAHLRTAREAAPGHALPHWAIGLVHASMEEHEGARESMRRAALLDPLSLPVTTGDAWVAIGAGDLQEAERKVWNSLELEPDAPHSLWQLGIIRQMAGHLTEAITAFRQAHTHSPADPLVLASLGHALATAGEEAESRLILRRLTAPPAVELYVPPLAIAMVHAGRGEPEEARRWLERGLAEQDGLIAFLGPWPFTRSLQSEPWFEELRVNIFPAVSAAR